MANADFSMWGSSWQLLKLKNGPYVASHLGSRLTDHPRQSNPPNLQGVLIYSKPYANSSSKPFD